MEDITFNEIIQYLDDQILKNPYSEDPKVFLRRMLPNIVKIYLMRINCNHKNEIMHGKWIKHNNEEVCSVCYMDRKHSDLKGICVFCGSNNEEE